MTTIDRRHLLKTAVGAGAAVATGRWLEPTATAADQPKKRIKIGQIGTGNQHAYKMSTLRTLPDLFEVVGFVEDDPKLREKALNSSAFKGLKVMSTEELLAVPGLQAVAVASLPLCNASGRESTSIWTSRAASRCPSSNSCWTRRKTGS